MYSNRFHAEQVKRRFVADSLIRIQRSEAETLLFCETHKNTTASLLSRKRFILLLIESAGVLAHQAKFDCKTSASRK